MSLSPIVSMIKDFLIVVLEAVEFGGPRLRDMCNDVGATLLFSRVGEFLLLCNVEPLNFLFEDWEGDMNDLESTLLVCAAGVLLLRWYDTPFTFFIDGWDEEVTLVVDIGFDVGVEILEDFVSGDTIFFLFQLISYPL